jgi:hypothetical protein
VLDTNCLAHPTVLDASGSISVGQSSRAFNLHIIVHLLNSWKSLKSEVGAINAIAERNSTKTYKVTHGLLLCQPKI